MTGYECFVDVMSYVYVYRYTPKLDPRILSASSYVVSGVNCWR